MGGRQCASPDSHRLFCHLSEAVSAPVRHPVAATPVRGLSVSGPSQVRFSRFGRAETPCGASDSFSHPNRRFRTAGSGHFQAAPVRFRSALRRAAAVSMLLSARALSQALQARMAHRLASSPSAKRQAFRARAGRGGADRAFFPTQGPAARHASLGDAEPRQLGTGSPPAAGVSSLHPSLQPVARPHLQAGRPRPG